MDSISYQRQNPGKKSGGGCLVAIVVSLAVAFYASMVAVSLAAVILSAAFSGSARPSKPGHRGPAFAADQIGSSAEDDTLPRLVWERGGSKGDPVVLRLRLSGAIAFEDEKNDLLGIREKSPSSLLLRRIRQATQDDEVRGICLELDTPGGEVTAADVITDALWAFKETDTNRFVVVHMGSLCCSGGYYIASAADSIVAHPTTTTGSIGVIMSTVNAAELARKVGVESVTIATGDNKNMLDPFKPVVPEHVEIFRKVVASDYERFLQVVSDGRGIPVADVRKIADGRIFSAEEALELKLIDAIGYRDDVYDVMTKLAGGEVRVCRYEEDMSFRSILSGLFASASPAKAAADAVGRLIPSVSAPKIEFMLH